MDNSKTELKCECGHDAHPDEPCLFSAGLREQDDGSTAAEYECPCDKFRPVIELADVLKLWEECKSCVKDNAEKLKNDEEAAFYVIGRFERKLRALSVGDDVKKD